MSRRRTCVLLTGIAVGVISALAISAAAPASDSAFRGRNGPIVFASRMDFTYDQVIHHVGAWEIYTTHASGGGFTRLTHNRANDNNPRWSPDASRVAFVRQAPNRKVYVGHIYVMNANGTGEHNISGRHNDRVPSWSPDGKHIAFDSGRLGDLWIMNADGSNRREVRSAEGHRVQGTFYAPVWSPDGREIDFDGSDPDTWENPEGGVWAVNVETGAVRRVFREPLVRIEWSPDGKRMLMFDHRGLEVARADGTHRRLVKRRNESVFGCTWSPDGRKLACIEHFPHEEDVELTVMNVDTTGMIRLTTNYADEAPTDLDWGRARG